MTSQTSPAGSHELRARLIDDTGAPMPDASVSARAERTTREIRFEPCASPALSRHARERTLLTTSADGTLCVRVAGGDAVSSIELAYDGDGLHLPVTAQVPLRETAVPSRLAFEAPSIELDLDQPAQRLRLLLSNLPEAGLAPRIELSLHEADRERRIEAQAWSRQADAIDITVSSEQMGAPGPARLVASLAQGEGQPPLRAECVALKVTTVHVTAEVTALESERAILQVQAASTGGVPTSGWVEAWRDGQSVASTPLEAGRAELELSLSTPGPAHVSVRYRPEEPWWLVGDPFELTLQRAVPRAPGRWPWLVLIAPIAWVCSRALQRPAPRNPVRSPPRRAPAKAQMAAPPQTTIAGWSGKVIDAHDGAPIPGAMVQISLPSLIGTAGASTSSDARGVFVLPAFNAPPPEGARMHISAPLHTEVERALPPQGRVDITMISRRRLLLRRLVRWARAMGTPWHRGAEPTPREIANVALRRGEPHTARWAEAIESAAFGSSDVDVGLEAALRGQEPAWTQTGRMREERPREDDTDD